MFSGVFRGFSAAIATLVDRWRFDARRRNSRTAAASLENASVLVSLRRDGFAVVPGYYSSAKCRALCAEIDALMAEQSDIIQRDRFDADYRVFGAELAVADIGDFNADLWPRQIGESYGRTPLVAFSTLAARLQPRAGNIGSGQGWHRDAFHFQYKAMIYLSDVGPENGPFEMLVGSHRLLQVLLHAFHGRLDKPPRTRISESQIVRLLAAQPSLRRTFTAPAGTLIMFDSSTIHRGSPIRAGIRYALTNYYYPPSHISQPVIDGFAPFARPRAGVQSKYATSRQGATS